MNKNKYLNCVLVFSFLFSLFPLVVDFGNFLPTLVFFVLLVTSGITGKLLFGSFFKEGDQLDSLLFIILGFLFFSIISLFGVAILCVLIVLLTGYQLVKSYYVKEAQLNIEHNAIKRFDFFLLFSLAFGYLFIGDDFWQAKHLYVTNYNDAYYFTALTESLKRTGYWNAFFDINAPINYQFASLLIPALITKIIGVTSNQALYLYAMPFYKVAGLMAFPLTLNRLLEEKKVFFNYPFLIAGILFFTLTSLNPLNIFKLKTEGFIFLSVGNFLPGGNPCLTFGFIFLSFFLMLICKTERSVYDGMFTLLLLVIILVSKVALWLPAVVFYLVYEGCYFIKFRNNIRFFSIAIASLLISLATYYLLFGSYSNAKIVIEPFIELKQFIERGYHVSSSSLVNQFVLFIFFLVLAFGIRLLILTLIFFTKIKQFMFVALASMASLAASSIFLLMLKIYCIDQLGKIVADASFNLEQFVRCSFIIIMFFSVFFSMYLLKNLQALSRKFFMGCLILYCAISAVGLISFSSKFNLNFKEDNNVWREQIRSSLVNVIPKGSFCMIGNSLTTRSYLLCADGIGPWWYSGRTGDGSDAYYQSNKNLYRAAYVDSIVHGNDPLQALRHLKLEGVRYLVTTPLTRARVDSISVAGGLTARDGSNYVYEFK